MVSGRRTAGQPTRPISRTIAILFAALGALTLLPVAPVLAAEPTATKANARGAPAPAQVSRPLLANGNLLAMYQIVGGQNQCFIYSYDHNGNRLTRRNLDPGATVAWGTAVYGCYNWTTP